MNKKSKEGGLRVKNTGSFRLKDRPSERSFQAINLKNQFGFVPEVIIIQKVLGRNNRIFVAAVLTKEEIEKEDKLKKETIKAKKIKKEI